MDGYHLQNSASAEERISVLMSHLTVEVATVLQTKQQNDRIMEKLQGDLSMQANAYKYLAERNRMLEEQVRTLEASAESLRNERHHTMQNTQRRVLCLIDGDGTIFSLALIARGRDGGMDAAHRLATSIQEYMGASSASDLWIYVFLNKRGLMGALGRAGHKEEAIRFEEFLAGFNQAGEKSLMIDVGIGKEMADARLRVYLQDNVHSPITKKIFFGGCHDNGYAFPLRSLITDGLKDKLVLLPGLTELAAGFKDLDLPRLDIADLFIPEKLVTAVSPVTETPPVPLPISMWRGSTWATKPTAGNGASRGLTSDSSSEFSDDVPVTPVIQAPTPKNNKTRRVNPALSLAQQKPPPCNMFYLAPEGCKFGSTCTYGHSYILEADHYDELRVNAKKGPCPFLNKGNPCPHGEKCIYGHVCPQGPQCHYKKTGTCKFVGKGMHSA